jgi:hypothetical protein
VDSIKPIFIGTLSPHGAYHFNLDIGDIKDSTTLYYDCSVMWRYGSYVTEVPITHMNHAISLDTAKKFDYRQKEFQFPGAVMRSLRTDKPQLFYNGR